MACNCSINLPHDPQQLSGLSNRAMPTVICTLNPEFDTHTVQAMEARNFMKELNMAVHQTAQKADGLGDRVYALEHKVENAQKTGALQHRSDCIYAKKFAKSLDPRPPDFESEDVKTIKMLRDKLEKSSKQSVKLRNLNLKLTSDIQQCKYLIGRELGLDSKSMEDIDEMVRSRASMGWRSRVEIIRNLRHKVVILESKLHNANLELKHEADKDNYDPSFQVDIRYSVSKHQRQVLDKLNAEKSDQLRDKEDMVQFLDQKYQKLENEHKAVKSRNKTLMEDLAHFKEKVKILEEKASGDEELIQSLMSHQNLMRDMLQQHFNSRIRQSIREQDLLDLATGEFDIKRKSFDKDIDGEKFKTLFKASEDTSRRLEDLIVNLQDRLEGISLQVVEAERHCCDHQCRLHDLSEQFQNLKRTGKMQPRQKTKHGQLAREAIAQEQLNVIKGENQLLRGFLKDTVLGKVNDFQLYKTSLEVTRRGYLVSLNEIRQALSSKKAQEDVEPEM